MVNMPRARERLPNRRKHEIVEFEHAGSISAESDIESRVAASLDDDDMDLADDEAVANEPKLSEATLALLTDMAALRQLGRAVALAPHGQRLEAFTAVAHQAAELVLGGAIKRQDTIDHLMDIAWAHGCGPSHLRTCEQIVLTTFTNIS